MTRAARWLITGAGGMVGTDLLHTLQKGNADVVALTKSDLRSPKDESVRLADIKHLPGGGCFILRLLSRFSQKGQSDGSPW